MTLAFAVEPTAMSAHVLIVGAGLGGLALAQGLKRQGINFTIFERDTTPDTRMQGYRIKVFSDTTPDLQYLMTPELFAEFEAVTSETVMMETAINAVDGRVLARRALRGLEPYTVDRGFFRKVLLLGLGGRIQWGKSLTHYEVNEANKESPVTINFSDGSTASGTLLVGADGGRSLIRRQHVPHHKIIDPECVCIYGRTFLTPELEQRIHPKLLGGGLALVRDVAPVLQQVIFGSELPVTMFVERMHFPQRGPDRPCLPEDYMYWSISAPSKLFGSTEKMVATAFNAKTARELGLSLTGEWDGSTRCIVEMQDEAYAVSLRVTTSTPELSEWEPSPFVTLIGDAIHVMSPSGGVGAATALKDAVALTKALAGPDGISLASIKAYEATMRSTAKVAIERSFRGGKILYGQPPLEDCRVLVDA
jgi:2-polyprenyl-6-methoxyphenol hydroxylase-like FAD-dependent oxidoreductase